jgi:type I restriction enzyme R subunit
VPFEDRGGFYEGRYYQDIAIDRVLEAIAAEKPRILLTLATGTCKTFIAFQIAWKLFHSRWNLSREPSRRPRILFLADRNILADQPITRFRPFRRMRWCGSSRRTSAEEGACRRTVVYFSPSSRRS